jgi:hypothetical protein
MRADTPAVMVAVSSLVDEDLGRASRVQINPICSAVAVDVDEVDTRDPVFFVLRRKSVVVFHLRQLANIA